MGKAGFPHFDFKVSSRTILLTDVIFVFKGPFSPPSNRIRQWQGKVSEEGTGAQPDRPSNPRWKIVYMIHMQATQTKSKIKFNDQKKNKIHH